MVFSMHPLIQPDFYFNLFPAFSQLPHWLPFSDPQTFFYAQTIAYSHWLTNPYGADVPYEFEYAALLHGVAAPARFLL